MTEELMSTNQNPSSEAAEGSVSVENIKVDELPTELTKRPDSWIVTPVKQKKKNGKTKPSELIWYEGEEVLAKIKVTPENFSELLPVLQSRFGGSGVQPDEWFIKVPPPLTNQEPEPVLSFVQNGRVLMALPMNQNFLKSFTKSLDAYIIKPPTKITALNNWLAKHKVLRVFAAFFTLLIVFGILAAFGNLIAIGA